MKTVTFKNWSLTALDTAFGLKQIWNSTLMQDWEHDTFPINEFETEHLLKLQRLLIRGGRSWNEVELENKFISPIIMLADIDDEQIGYFLERHLYAIIGNYEFSDVITGMIATGFREPGMPFFCLHQHKCDDESFPDAQVLAAMLVAREQNNKEKPIYGLFVVGMIWNFVILEGNDYCISHEFKATDTELFNIFNMLKKLKKIIKTTLIN